MEDILARIEVMHRMQMKSNSRIVRAALCASIASQATLFLVLINSANFVTGVLGVIVNIVAAFCIRSITRSEGRREWPSDELGSYD